MILEHVYMRFSSNNGIKQGHDTPVVGTRATRPIKLHLHCLKVQSVSASAESPNQMILDGAHSNGCITLIVGIVAQCRTFYGTVAILPAAE